MRYISCVMIWLIIAVISIKCMPANVIGQHVNNDGECVDQQCLDTCTVSDKEICSFMCECEIPAELNTILPSACVKKRKHKCKVFCFGTCHKICHWKNVLDCNNLTNG